MFGCAGSTNLTAAAINWATDPNRDGNPSDHVDVINMSLGSAYGTPDDPSAAASNNAADLGVLVVTSAGNSGDSYFVSGSPGSAHKAHRDGLVAGRGGAGGRDHRQQRRLRSRASTSARSRSQLQLERDAGA